MNQVVKSSDAPSFRSLLEPIQSDLESVESILRRELVSDVDAVSNMLGHPMFWGGKRIRPTLLLLAGKATGEVNAEHHLLAAVLEMIHAATLVHDDVLDNAEMRRHCPSLNQSWGNQLCVLLGDFLFSHAFYLASTLDSTHASQLIGRATNAVCQGEMMQINSQGNLSLTEDDYFRIIDGKTGRLCACAAELGAFASEADLETQATFAELGLNYGRAFQIIDDILDFQGSEKVVGKSLGSDARQAKLTLPLIHALRTVTPDETDKWTTVLQSGNCTNHRQCIQAQSAKE